MFSHSSRQNSYRVSQQNRLVAFSKKGKKNNQNKKIKCHVRRFLAKTLRWQFRLKEHLLKSILDFKLKRTTKMKTEKYSIGQRPHFWETWIQYLHCSCYAKSVSVCYVKIWGFSGTWITPDELYWIILCFCFFISWTHFRHANAFLA